MSLVNKKEPILLLLGDLLIFDISLWLMLFIRHFEVPSSELIVSHIAPFSILFLVWIVSFYIAGLYEKHTIFLRDKLPSTILNTQIFNSLVAVLFFYLIPYFGITPKTNLFIYIVVSFGLVQLVY
jgi:FlaA1/EpsC-like NDP-sugar epimerase